MAGYLAILSFSTCALAQINVWINPSSGSWDQATNWSLGIVPASSQSIWITNSGWKAVAINPSTPVDSPESMTVNDIAIRGAWDTRNVLLLNHFGTGVPLTLVNGLTVRDNAQLLNYDSGLAIQNGDITVTNAQIVQDGGFFRATNSTLYLQNGEYSITNGLFDALAVLIGGQNSSISSRFNQYGGAVSIANLGFLRSPWNAGGGYALHGGYLYLPGGLSVTGDNGAATSYVQTGGTNGTTQVHVEPGLYGTTPEFKLSGGLLTDDSVAVLGDNFGKATLEQSGGTHSISNILLIAGGSTHGQTVQPGTYLLNDGTLSARLIELNGNQGDALLVQSNGTTRAGNVWAHSIGWFGSFNTGITLMGGSLSCSNLTIEDGRGVLYQGGGALVVSNLLEVGGFRDIGLAKYYGTYDFKGGTLSANNINIIGDWVIGDSPIANRISNSGYTRLSHRLVIGNATEQLGRFILASNATIRLAGNTSQLSFANSSGENWAGGAALIVLDWNGNSAGGGAEQLKFGASQSGLTQAQLSRISFQVGSDLYQAKMLNSGEVVPDQLVARPSITFTTQPGNKLVLSWPSAHALQSATNVSGPFYTVPGATSPYTNDMSIDPQRFFRIEQ